MTHETHNLKTITDQMIACPVLTSFSIKSAGFLALEDRSSGLEQSALIWVPWSRLKETVDLAIWSRGHGFLVDNTDEEKAREETETARERYARRFDAERQSRKAASRVSSALDTDEKSSDGSAGVESH